MREVVPGNQGGGRGEAQPRCPDSQWVDQPDKNQHGRTSVERTADTDPHKTGKHAGTKLHYFGNNNIDP